MPSGFGQEVEKADLSEYLVHNKYGMDCNRKVTNGLL